MAFVIPEDKVSEIKNSLDIVEIVSETVMLKKAGKNYQGLCPFHTEKTPSFTVSPAKQIFYCFGCGEGGDVFRFLMKKEGLTFPEALRSLSKRCGIELPSPQLSPAQQQQMNEREALLTVNKTAMEYFANNLKAVEGKPARAYLNGRGVTAQTIDRYNIGFAPESWERLAAFFRSKNIPFRLGEKCGLIRARQQQSGYYDNFRSRIIFPIFDMGSRAIGFGGRVMDNSLPKYLNSPETPVYNKRRSLYGVQAARSASREKKSVFVVEGYFDLLALHQNGIENSVATLGTALTPEHIQILKGFIGETGHVVLVFDSDAAGIKAAERSVDVFLKNFVDARILVLPKGYDPDSFLLEKGVDPFLAQATRAQAIVPFMIEAAIRRHGLSTDGKVRIVSDLEDLLATVEDSMTRSLHLRDLAERIGVDEAAVRDRINSKISGNRDRADRNVPNGPFAGKVDRENDAIDLSGSDRLERKIIAMMFQFPDIIAHIRMKNLLTIFRNSRLRHIGEMILKETSSPADKPKQVVSSIISGIKEDRLRSEAASLAIEDVPWDDDGCKKLIDQFERSLKRQDKSLIHLIRSAENAGDHDLVARLQQQLIKETRSLVSRKY